MDREPASQIRTRDEEARRSYSDDGVDLTLIRWMLSLTPAERLMTLQNNIRSLERLAVLPILRRTLEERGGK